MPDITLTPDFTESAELMRAYWAESFGTPIDGVVSFDPSRSATCSAPPAR